MRESGIEMFFHSMGVAVVLYLLLHFALGQRREVAMDRSLLVGGLVLVYMILFGHGWPTKINKNIW